MLLVASQLPILLIAPRSGEGEREYTSGRKAFTPQPWLRVIKVSLHLYPQPHHCVVLPECCAPLQGSRGRLALSAVKLSWNKMQ